MDPPPDILRFGAFALDRGNRQLTRDGVPVDLGSRYFDALALLVARPGELVTKDAFMEQVWHGIPVTDEALTQCIRTLRRALGDDASAPRFIETVPKHGYRFIAAPSAGAGAAPAPRAAKAGAARPAAPSQVAGAATLAGLAAGALAGLAYGVIAGTGGGGQVLILAAMVGALGLLAGAGLGAGLAAAIAWRGRADAWAVGGTALGGLVVGALGNLLSREGVGLLSGIAIAQATGPFEGAVVGVAAGCAGWAALASWTRPRALAVAVLAAAAAAAVIVAAGGTMLAGSLHALEQGLPSAQLAMERIGGLLGQSGFTPTAAALSVLIECEVLIASLASSLLALRGRAGQSSPPWAPESRA